MDMRRKRMVDQYFEYKMYTDFYIPAVILVICVFFLIIIGIYKFIVWVRDKINGRK